MEEVGGKRKAERQNRHLTFACEDACRPRAVYIQTSLPIMTTIVRNEPFFQRNILRIIRCHVSNSHSIRSRSRTAQVSTVLWGRPSPNGFHGAQNPYQPGLQPGT